MRYYPKNKIKTNLFTNGGEYLNTQTGKPYTGYYHKFSDGSVYIGKDYSYKPRTLLIPISKEPEHKEYTIRYNQDIKDYLKLRGIPKDKIKNLPKPYYPTPSYEKEYFMRYFVKRIGIERYIEVEEEIYQRFIDEDEDWAWELYIPFQVKWVIKGNKDVVYKKNLNSVSEVSRNLKLRNFRKFLGEDFLKFYNF